MAATAPVGRQTGGLPHRGSQQLFQQISVYLAQLGVLRQDQGVRAVLEHQAWPLGMGFPTRLVAQLVQALHAGVQAAGELAPL